MAAISRRHVQMHFLVWNLFYFDFDFTGTCPQGFNEQLANIISDNDLVPNREQAIIGTNTSLVYWRPGARLTRAYDVTIQRYRNSHPKIHDIKMHILRCMGSKFCVKFQSALWNFTQNFEPIHGKICILWGGKNLTTYDILELWHLKS